MHSFVKTNSQPTFLRHYDIEAKVVDDDKYIQGNSEIKWAHSSGDDTLISQDPFTFSQVREVMSYYRDNVFKDYIIESKDYILETNSIILVLNSWPAGVNRDKALEFAKVLQELVSSVRKANVLSNEFANIIATNRFIQESNLREDPGAIAKIKQAFIKIKHNSSPSLG